MSPNMDSRQHPLEGRPGFARYLRSEQIAQEADSLLDGWGPLVSPESLNKAERFIYQYFATDDLRSFPWEKDPLLLEDLELATYYKEALKMFAISMKLAGVAIGKKFGEKEALEISNLDLRQEKWQKVGEIMQRNVRQVDHLSMKLYSATRLWLKRVEPAMEVRRASMRAALLEEARLRGDPE